VDEEEAGRQSGLKSISSERAAASAARQPLPVICHTHTAKCEAKQSRAYDRHDRWTAASKQTYMSSSCFDVALVLLVLIYMHV
jgi:hypothetical protein